MLVTFVTLIPQARNDGSPVTAAEQEQILGQLLGIAGRLTIEGTVEGIWHDEQSGKTYRDRSCKVILGCPWQRAAELEALVADIGRQLGQKEMYLEIRGGSVINTIPCER
jgi:hypothetical protein